MDWCRRIISFLVGNTECATPRWLDALVTNHWEKTTPRATPLDASSCRNAVLDWTSLVAPLLTKSDEVKWLLIVVPLEAIELGGQHGFDWCGFYERSRDAGSN